MAWGKAGTVQLATFVPCGVYVGGFHHLLAGPRHHLVGV